MSVDIVWFGPLGGFFHEDSPDYSTSVNKRAMNDALFLLTTLTTTAGCFHSKGRRGTGYQAQLPTQKRENRRKNGNERKARKARTMC